MYIISRCLLGIDCKYNGENNRNEELIEFCRTHDYVAICPEEAGGLGTPRDPSEIIAADIIDGKTVFKVISKQGVDVSEEFDYGARLSLASIMVEAGSRKPHAGIIEGAILKSNSPSCGSGTVYDGTFSHNIVKGFGVFADKLIDACLEERSNPDISDDDRVFSSDFKVCDEKNFARVFG